MPASASHTALLSGLVGYMTVSTATAVLYLGPHSTHGGALHDTLSILAALVSALAGLALHADSDGDRVLDATEFAAVGHSLHRSLDLDSDGSAELHEAAIVMAAMGVSVALAAYLRRLKLAALKTMLYTEIKQDVSWPPGFSEKRTHLPIGRSKS